MQQSDPTRNFYDACNATELYQLCTRVGLVVSPATPRERLVSYLIGDELPPALEHPVHVWRNGLIGLIEDYWTSIEAQLRCPAKELGPPAKEGEPPKPDPSDSKAPRACYRCVDTRVLACLVENAKHENRIQLHRKMTVTPQKDSNDMGTIGTLTLETAPRTLEGMSAGDGVGRGPLKRLYDALMNDGAAPGDEKAVVAFVDADTETRRKLVIQYLQVWDQMKGRAGAGVVSQGTVVQAGAAPGAPAPTPVVSGASAAPKRTPRNAGKATDAQGEESGASMNIGDAIVQHLDALREGLVGIKTMLEGNGAQAFKLEQRSASQHAELMSAIQGLEKSVKTSAAITLWQIENQMDTAPSEVLAQAATYIVILDRFAAGGKAS